ncbi:16S rRNA (guanine(966)-N(2))-methyltransferase RsmD [candidate division WOR-3 bacterium]|uniref:16S rRNA (Guanine(966)-N(2))-methyltransferase RsmD n=1 Tax=candidate division WOR-3 bacterium TaxID=2052148 RepID=A0A9D5K9H9_UNCW3|nr:16S rRNA (guanine(966)-N(2))-methyltransferase RsmD [candidate division WOR-3 bacterium]MBD3364968.1 16S rRNA (guanine(966)-N(2))-methyltransferase RsmD [candidate division WOR-3 bacterium]
MLRGQVRGRDVTSGWSRVEEDETSGADLPRITAGRLGGRRLKYPKGGGFRPTMDVVKEALFSILADGIEGAGVLDLFAASGALGLEAISRGAEKVVFVEKNVKACRMLSENIKLLGVEDRTEVVNTDALIYLKRFEFSPTYVFCDPPYRSGLASQTLLLLDDCRYIGNETIIVIEHAADERLDIPSSMIRNKTRDYGETRVSFLRKKMKGEYN